MILSDDYVRNLEVSILANTALTAFSKTQAVALLPLLITLLQRRYVVNSSMHTYRLS